MCNSHTTLYTCNSMAAGQPLTLQCQPHITTGFIKGAFKALFFMNLIDVQNHVTLKWGRTFKVISPNSHPEQKHSHCPGPDIEAPYSGASIEAWAATEREREVTGVEFLGQCVPSDLATWHSDSAGKSDSLHFTEAHEVQGLCELPCITQL